MRLACGIAVAVVKASVAAPIQPLAQELPYASNVAIKIRKMYISNVDKIMEKLEHSYSTTVNLKWYSHCGKEFGGISKC